MTRNLIQSLTLWLLLSSAVTAAPAIAQSAVVNFPINGRVAVEAREDPDFLIVARSDAFWVSGDLEDSIARLRLYADAGAVIFGLRMSAISAFFGVWASNERTIVVLPVPTSPVSCTKPPASLMP